MIVGNGLLANAFDMYRTRDDVTVFASGVSNSLEDRKKEFHREQELLIESLGGLSRSLFIYFGTCSIYDPSMRGAYYIRHKLKMEQIIVDSGLPYLIFRLPQIVGKSNNDSTLTNYLFSNILHEHHFYVWKKAIRFLVDIADVVRYVSYVFDDRKEFNRTINFFMSSCNVVEIVSILEDIIGKKAHYTLLEKGEPYSIPITNTFVPEDAGILLNDNYVENVLLKYYSLSDVSHETMPVKFYSNNGLNVK